MLTVGNTSGEPVTAFWALAASEVSGECLEPSQYYCPVLPSLLSVSFLFSLLRPAITPHWEEMLACKLYRVRVFLAVPEVLSLKSAGGLVPSLVLLKVATVPPKKGFSRNCGVKCILLKLAILFFISLFSISYICSKYGCNTCS